MRSICKRRMGSTLTAVVTPGDRLSDHHIKAGHPSMPCPGCGRLVPSEFRTRVPDYPVVPGVNQQSAAFWDDNAEPVSVDVVTLPDGRSAVLVGAVLLHECARPDAGDRSPRVSTPPSSEGTADLTRE